MRVDTANGGTASGANCLHVNPKGMLPALKIAAGMGVPLRAARFGLGNSILFVLLGLLVGPAIIDSSGLPGLAARPVSGMRLPRIEVMAPGAVLSQRG